ncbi:RagB/SusD family nutrient uptake outer membrane protein [Deminuibacter soli]|uniref:RagB/SusD family nutrient uptake outer membrane protein n=1 Tax=Deminuibacter soli TaxID=2291815 RepID=A0A3E1NEY1_9BACT|nr:RagB/SusD family nutrient uptake outer membrane protein [Deminuibacter soli]RFM26361.1 RagB/SusD family nutrient uptake outer membrane protein [Deminuibacter soli]
MKNKIITGGAVLMSIAVFNSSCSKLLDKQPQTNVISSVDTTAQISATDAEASIKGLYTYYKNNALEWSAFDRITNGDVLADNAYAGGDNSDNITIDNFTFNSLNGNINRDWADAYAVIGRANILIDNVAHSKDAAFTATRKAQITGEAKFFRAWNYFDLVKLYGRLPLKLKPSDATSSESLFNSSLVAQSSTDSVYDAILSDLWYAKDNVQDVGANASKYIVSKGAVYATLAKVYATMATPKWDSVKYYSDLTIPQYSMLSDYTYLWDNAHKNNSEAIWEINYDGYNTGDKIGNWFPSILVGFDNGHFAGGGWKKFSTPANDLVNVFNAENDLIRLNASITFLDISGQWTDKNWPVTHYPFITKYNDPQNGTNDFYLIRLPDVLLLKAEALAQTGDVSGAMNLVNQVRARVNLGAKTAASAAEALDAVLLERRLELAFEGHRWFDLLRTGKALQVMNAVKDGNGQSLNYNVPAYRLLYPIPQNQIDLNPKLTQTSGY